MGFVAGKVTLEEIFLPVFQFSLVSVFPSVLLIRLVTKLYYYEFRSPLNNTLKNKRQENSPHKIVFTSNYLEVVLVKEGKKKNN